MVMATFVILALVFFSWVVSMREYGSCVHCTKISFF